MIVEVDESGEEIRWAAFLTEGSHEAHVAVAKQK